MTVLFLASFINMKEAGRNVVHLSDTESSSNGEGGKKTLWECF